MRLLNYLAAISLALVPGTFVTGSCGLVLDSFEKVDGGPGGDADAGGDAAPACTHETYPPFPADVVDSGDIDFTVAIRSVDLGEKSTDTEPVGLDLDKTCTCLGEGPSCVPPKYANKSNCDARNGVDNAAAKIFESVVFAIGNDKFGSGFYSQMAEKGEWSALIRVQGYNGQKEDPKVRFIMYTTPGYGGQSGAGGAGGAGGFMVEPDPKWDGTDEWPVSASSLADGMTVDMPLYSDDNAYVAGGTLVANLPQTTIELNGTGSHFSIKLTAGTFMGSLQNPPDNQGWRIASGLLLGRWKTTDLFENLATFTTDGTSICNNGDLIYTQFKKTICGYVDIASALGGATTPCDALSFGMKVITHPAKLGPLYIPDMTMSTCPEGQSPALDGCDK